MIKILHADEVSLAKLCHNHMSFLRWRPNDDYYNQFDKIKGRYESHIKRVHAVFPMDGLLVDIQSNPPS
jgi:hypothetical protein